MKIHYKSNDEIELLKESNALVTDTLAEIANWMKPGITTDKLNQKAEDYLRSHNGVPGFLGFKGYPKTLCTSVNSQVVHGIPSDYEIKEGDIVSIDCGVLLNGFYGDNAYTYAVGAVEKHTLELLKTTKASLFKGIEMAVVGNRLGDIGYAVQNYVEDRGFSVVREMVGHGIGKQMHEPPEVPNYGRRGRGVKLQKGLVICIEPMINMGKRNIKGSKDGWTVSTVDGLPSAHYELAVAIDHQKADVLSSFDKIEENIKNNIWLNNLL
jgi:methionyl aminopeptidase